MDKIVAQPWKKGINISVLFRPVIIGYRCQQAVLRPAVTHKRCNVFGIDKKRGLAGPLEKEREVKAFISGGTTKSVDEFGRSRISDRNSIVISDEFISIHITIFDIARHVVSKLLGRSVGNVILIDKQAFGDQTKRLRHRVSYLIAV